MHMYSVQFKNAVKHTKQNWNFFYDMTAEFFSRVDGVSLDDFV